MHKEDKQKRRNKAIVAAYPLCVLLIGVVVNLFVLEVKPPIVALPSDEGVISLIIAAVLLVINHTWLMTTTELTRVRFEMYATPEEWAASGTRRQDAPEEGLRELERRHNIHRNTTENVIYFIFLAFIFILVSPTNLTVQVWIIGFAVARLGYTYSYLTGRNNARGLFMSLNLLAIYGMASYLVISLFA
ncbi:MAG: MAPEG family protein [Alphaproteobacteria bacterium]|jgi:uncharacterized MAPEG superfamily protein|nr:MAPEG family protein [Alphaproteobacteria bacterium]